MADFLLIHGAGHGGWCWRKVISALTATGHSARAIDLPGPEAGQGGGSLDACTQAVVAGLAARSILVGHSLGGLSVTTAADRAPDRVAALVYLCAWVPVPGKALAEYRSAAVTPALRDAAEYDKTRDVSVFHRSKAAKVFYHDCSAEDREDALERLRPQSMQPHRTPIMLRNPQPPRYYIRCTRDRAIDPAYQRRVSQDWPAETVFDLDTGHSPFLAAPARLAGILDRIAKAAS